MDNANNSDTVSSAFSPGMFHYQCSATPFFQAVIAQNPVAVVPKTVVPAPPPILSLAREVKAMKHRRGNKLTFHVKAGSSILYSLMQPPSHAYEEPDVTWIKLLEAVALIPSGKPMEMLPLIRESFRIMPPGQSQFYRRQFSQFFLSYLGDTATAISASAANNNNNIHHDTSVLGPRDGLILKNHVNLILRTFLANPIHGYVLSKRYIQNGLFADDMVRTPVGRGFVRAYRASDRFYIVIFPWGIGYIHDTSLRPHDMTKE
jgi:hypothetical protein